MINRRSAMARTLTMGLAAAAAPLAARARAACAVPGFDRQRYEKYLEIFCAANPAFTDFYQSDVVMTIEMAGLPGGPVQRVMHGPAEILSSYQGLWTHFRERIEVLSFVSDATGLAVELKGAFVCVSDTGGDGGPFGRPVKKGEVRRQQGIVLYGVRDGKFSWIKAAPARQLHDWRMEGDAAPG